MNKDTHLIFEAYKKKLNENVDGTLIPSDDEIQTALEKYNSKCSVQDVKEAIVEVIERYKPTSADDLKDSLYEDHCDISNFQIGVGKQRFPYRESSVAEVAVRLANTKKMWNSMKERNARGENAEENNNKELTTNDIHRVVEHLFNTASKSSPYFPNIKYVYSGEVYDVLRKKGHEYFDHKTQDAVKAYEAHCMQAYESFNHDYSDGDEDTTTLTHAQDPETDVLWYSWGGDSYQSKAAMESAIRLADKHDFTKVVIDAQG